MLPYAVQPTATSTYTDRRIALVLLALPFLFTFISLIHAAFFSGIGDPGVQLTKTSIFTYAFLIAAILILPSYIISYGFYWWHSKGNGVIKPLILLPLVWAGFAWFPSILVSQGNFQAQFNVFAILSMLCLIIGYIWIGLLRLILRLWRGI
jgi:hypothetical protein